MAAPLQVEATPAHEGVLTDDTPTPDDKLGEEIVAVHCPEVVAMAAPSQVEGLHGRVLTDDTPIPDDKVVEVILAVCDAASKSLRGARVHDIREKLKGGMTLDELYVQQLTLYHDTVLEQLRGKGPIGDELPAAVIAGLERRVAEDVRFFAACCVDAEAKAPVGDQVAGPGARDHARPPGSSGRPARAWDRNPGFGKGPQRTSKKRR